MLSLITPLLESNQVVLPSLSDPLFLACLVATGIWLLLVAGFVYSTRPEEVIAAPPTMDLRPESPALVNLLVNGGRVTQEAVPATLLDLAAHEYIDIEEYGTSELVCRVKSVQPSGPLEPYAAMVLEHVKSGAKNGVVVAQALTTGPKGKATAWWKRFTANVEKDAETRGLVEDRWSTPMWSSVRVVGAVAGGLLVLFGLLHDAFTPMIMLVAGVALLLNQALVAIFGKYNHTAAGREHAAHWLGVRAYLEDNQAFRNSSPGEVELWDRYMSHAAAMGLAGRAIRALPMGAEDDNRAWSAYGGEWREVRVAYPSARIVWGRSPIEALFVSLVMGAGGVALLWLSLQVRDAASGVTVDVEEVTRWIEIGATIAVIVSLLVILVALRTLIIALFDAPVRREVTGEIIRARMFTGSKNNETRYYLAMYDGRVSKIRAWRVTPDIYHKGSQGDVATAVIAPRLGYVFELQPSNRRTVDSATPAAGASAAQ